MLKYIKLSFLLFLLVGCDLTNSRALDIKVTSFTLGQDTLSMNLGRMSKYQLYPKIVPEDANPTITWTSTNSAIVSVSGGLLTAKALGGPVTIIGSISGGSRISTMKVSVQPGIELSTYAYGVPEHYTPQTLVATLQSSTSAASTSWASDNTTVASVSSSGVVTFGTAGKATVSCKIVDNKGAEYLAFCNVRVFSRTSNTMQVGTNFWNLSWYVFTDYVKPAFSALATWPVANSADPAANPWTPAFLTDLGAYNGPLRFMDFVNVNYIPVVNWSDRIGETYNWTVPYAYPVVAATVEAVGNGLHGTNSKTVRDYIGKTTSSATVPAYEWMIDLCNRTGHDMWINIPTFSRNDQADVNDRYWTQLAILIKSKLDPHLKCFVEYSNETWNGGFLQNLYTMDQGTTMAEYGYNKWYWGEEFCVYNSIRIFKAFQDVFGEDNTGYDKPVSPWASPGLVRVYATAGNSDGGFKAIMRVMYNGSVKTSYDINTDYNTTYNPNKQKMDLMATAPYVGSGLDGSAGNIQSLFRAQIDWAYNVEVMTYINEMAKYGVKVGCYEGGQHLLKNSSTWSHNPAIYDEYIYMLNRWKAAGLVIFNHYVLYGSYSNATNTGSWGAKERISDSNEDSPKFRALKDWVEANP
jgi:hypothetical protein